MGYIIYEGPSNIDGKPIVCIYLPASKNIKTGNMAQTYIIRADIDPITANRIGEDYSICGNCVHKGIPDNTKTKGWANNRSCYVNLIHGPNHVYKAYKQGKYRTVKSKDIIELGIDQYIRMGTYGDPLAVPPKVWEYLISKAKGHTAYTHQWQDIGLSDSIDTFNMCMQSVDNKTTAQYAQDKGYRTFRVISIKDWNSRGINNLNKDEILCPASNEAGKKTTCINCNLCNGQQSKAKSIAIVAHGQGKNNYFKED